MILLTVNEEINTTTFNFFGRCICIMHSGSVTFFLLSEIKCYYILTLIPPGSVPVVSGWICGSVATVNVARQPMTILF